MENNLIDILMICFILFLLGTIFTGAILISMFQQCGIFIAALFIGIVICEIISMPLIIGKLEN